ASSGRRPWTEKAVAAKHRTAASATSAGAEAGRGSRGMRALSIQAPILCATGRGDKLRRLVSIPGCCVRRCVEDPERPALYHPACDTKGSKNEPRIPILIRRRRI